MQENHLNPTDSDTKTAELLTDDVSLPRFENQAFWRLVCSPEPLRRRRLAFATAAPNRAGSSFRRTPTHGPDLPASMPLSPVRRTTAGSPSPFAKPYEPSAIV